MDFLFRSKKPSQDIIKKYAQWGFSAEMTTRAWEMFKGDEALMLDHLISLNQQNQKIIQEISPYNRKNTGQYGREDSDITKAIELSLNEQNNSRGTYEPLNPEQRLRPNGLPVGLKNVGNTCYVNSLFQAYFMSPTFVAEVLKYNQEVSLFEDFMTVSPTRRGDQDIKRVRIEASIKLVKNLQRLFAKMIKSHKKYVDPLEVLNSVVDDMGLIRKGQKIAVGDQRDITEYHLNFLSRIEEAFYYQDKFLKSKNTSMTATPIQIEDLPASFMTIASLRGALQLDTSTTVTQEKENSLITRHFFGKMKQFMNFSQNDEKVTEEKEFIFGPIILDVWNKDLYTALEAYCNFILDDYRTPSGVQTKAQGNLWMTRAPELLFIQLNRVIFDKNSNAPVKLNNRFGFEKEIYLDRFMMDYKDEVLRVNKTIADLKAELDQKENSLQKIMNFLESKQNIINILELTGDFLEKQMSHDMNKPVIMYSDPTILGKVDEDYKLSIAAEIVRKYKQELENKMQDLKNSITSLKGTINNLWGKLNKHKYHLVSILIHDGVAGSGHYYSFNRNVQKDTWKRFNDFQVFEEKEEVVMTEALGGYANMSAYCLVYLSDKIIQQEINLSNSKPIDLMSDGIDIEIEKHYYSKILPQFLEQEVSLDNLLFREEVEESKFSTFLKSAVDLYRYRYDMVTKALQSKNSKSPPTHLNSFASFLKYDSHFENILKWHILDTVLHDLAGENHNLKLRNLQNSPHLFQKLQSRLSTLPRPFTMYNLVLTPQEENQLDCKLAEYSAEYPIMIYVKFLFVSIFDERWRDACYAAKLVFSIEKDQNSYVVKLVKDIVKVICIKMALQSEKFIKANQVDQGVNTMTYLTALVKGLLKPDESHTSQVKQIIIDALVEAKNKISDYSFNVFREQAQKFSGGFHVTAELDKVIENYSPQELDKDMHAFANEDLYGWKDINALSPSNQIANFFERFRNQHKIFVDFHNSLFTHKNTLKLEERRKLGYILP